MTVEVSLDASTNELLVKISGRFDFSLHQDFRKLSENQANNVKAISIDLSRTDYIDSSALGMLLILRDKVGDNKSAIKIINASKLKRTLITAGWYNSVFGF